MGSLSSSTLFHFTPKAEFLISILTNEFQPRYCLEKFHLGRKKIEIGIPMVCFCDIPLSSIKNHVETYGSYGIGMTKEWIQRNNLNPVMYLEKDSKLSNNLFNILIELQKDELHQYADWKVVRKSYVEVIRYIKPYQGDFLRGSALIKAVKFYDEREWRYTPEWTNDTPAWITKNEFENPISLALKNEQLKSQKLSFEPKDIKYIIVKDESEIYAMIDSLKKIKSKYDSRTIEILTSRIITCNEILNDL
jgi:hypothetical protein